MFSSIAAIDVPVWFVNGRSDQLRLNERQFVRRTPRSHLIVVPRAHHLLTVMCPHAFNDLLDAALTDVAPE